MPSHRLPARPNLEHLRKQAKDLLKAYRAADPAAIVRLHESLPRLSSSAEVHPDLTLRGAQRIIAMERGFDSWLDLRNHIESQERYQMIEMKIDSVKTNPQAQMRTIVLRSEAMRKYLAIWIGPAEGDLIALKLQGKELPRPMTHDLLESTIRDLGASVTQVVVTEMQDETFLAKIVLQSNGSTLERDCRPSDAIALAVRCDAQIFVEPTVLDSAGVEYDPQTGKPLSTDILWYELPSLVFEDRPTVSQSMPSADPLDMFSEPVRGLLERAGAKANREGRSQVEFDDLIRAMATDPKFADAGQSAEGGTHSHFSSRELDPGVEPQ